MIRVRLLQQRVGINRFGSFLNQLRGTEIEVPADEGRRMIAAGQAVLVETAVVETAMQNHRAREKRTTRKQ